MLWWNRNDKTGHVKLAYIFDVIMYGEQGPGPLTILWAPHVQPLHLMKQEGLEYTFAGKGG